MDIHRLAHRNHRAAHDARSGDPQRQAQYDNDLPRPWAEHGDHDDQHDQFGEAHPGIDEALRDHVEPAAEIAAEDADHDRDHRRQARGAEADDHRHARAVQAARQHVPSQVVCPERMVEPRWLQAVDGTDLVEAIGCQHVGEQATQQEQHADHAADRAQRLVAEQPRQEGRERGAPSKGDARAWDDGDRAAKGGRVNAGRIDGAWGIGGTHLWRTRGSRRP